MKNISRTVVSLLVSLALFFTMVGNAHAAERNDDKLDSVAKQVMIADLMTYVSDDTLTEGDVEKAAEAIAAQFDQIPDEAFVSEEAYLRFKASLGSSSYRGGVAPQGFWEDAAKCGAALLAVAVNVLPWGQFLKLARIMKNVGKAVDFINHARKIWPIARARHGSNMKAAFIESVQYGLIQIGEENIGRFLARELFGISFEGLAACTIIITGTKF